MSHILTLQSDFYILLCICIYYSVCIKAVYNILLLDLATYATSVFL